MDMLPMFLNSVMQIFILLVHCLQKVTFSMMLDKKCGGIC
jgi:hypothetical protein